MAHHASGQVVMAYPAGAVRLTAANNTWAPAFLHKDHLGSVRAISGAGGAVEERTLYRPYGGQTEVATATLNDDKSWLGERYDAGAGLQYLNARYYDPELAMFLQSDWLPPMRAGVSRNRFAYALGDPVNLIDVSGNEAYVVTRDLKSFSLGSHSFITIVTTSPSNYPPRMQENFKEVTNSSGGIPGVGVGETAHVLTIGGQPDENGNLVNEVNNAEDMESVQEVAAGDTSLSSYNADVGPELDNDNDPTTPPGTSLDVDLYDAGNAYNGSLDYDILADFGPGRSGDGYNSNGLARGIAHEGGAANYPENNAGADVGGRKPAPSSTFPEPRTTPTHGPQ